MRSLRARILRTHLAQVALVLLAFSTALFLVVRWRLTVEVDRVLDQTLQSICSRVRIDDGDELEFQFEEGEYPADIFWRIALTSGDELGRSHTYPTLEGSPPLESAPHEVVRAPDGERFRRVSRRITVGERPRRYELEWTETKGEVVVQEKPPKPSDLEFDVAVSVARSLTPRDDAVMTLLGILALAIPLALALAAVGGLRLARRIVRPISALIEATERIGPGTLSERLPLSGSGDEIDRLSAVVNGMLARIETGYERERRFTSDASHELRSPLTALRGQIEVALRRDRSAEEYASVLRGSLEDVERLERLAADLLLLARTEAEPAGRWSSPPVDIAKLAREVTDEVAAQAPDRVLDASGVRDVGEVPGVPDLLRVLVRNLLENAVRHGRGDVRVELQRAGALVRLEVADRGSGLPEEDLERVFDRFYRVDRARSRSSGGTGLGLAIVRAIVEAHAGSVAARNSNEGGARLIVELPRAASSSDS